MAKPVSQKANDRPISFFLTGGGSDVHLKLVLRPEDLARSQPMMLNAQQTFDGAFIDCFGRGIATINISGTTGWQLGRGGETEFHALHDAIMMEWANRRKGRVDAGLSPDDVRLIFSDKLDNVVNVVAPTNFVLKRNKSRPLLLMYQISLIVVAESLSRDLADPLKAASEGRGASVSGIAKGIASLKDSISKISDGAGRVRNFIDNSIAAPVGEFMEMTTGIMNEVVDGVQSVQGLVSDQASQLIGIASDIALVGRNIFYSYNAIAGLPDFVRWEVAGIASAYENAYCVLQNSLKQPALYPDYSDVYGASVCSSTVGGSPLSPLRGSNPFEAILPPATSPVRVTQQARGLINSMRAADPVLQPIGMAAIGNTAATITRGVTLA